MKLAIFDKDGTLTTTVSGETFVQHPKDQKLLPGVAKGLKAMADDGWHFAIASNQGGVMVRECKVLDFPVGAYYVNGLDKPVKIIRKNILPKGVLLHTAEPRPNGKEWLYLATSSVVKYQYKSLDAALAEMRYCLELTGIKSGYFCTNEGATCYWAGPSDAIGPIASQIYGNYRKPGPGMLELAMQKEGKAFERYLYVGDRPEDEKAANQVAGTRFMWADDWRGQYV